MNVWIEKCIPIIRALNGWCWRCTEILRIQILLALFYSSLCVVLQLIVSLETFYFNRYTIDITQNEVIAILSLISHWLCYANSAINPLIYNFMSGKYKMGAILFHVHMFARLAPRINIFKFSSPQPWFAYLVWKIDENLKTSTFWASPMFNRRFVLKSNKNILSRRTATKSLQNAWKQWSSLKWLEQGGIRMMTELINWKPHNQFSMLVTFVQIWMS